MIGRLAPLVGEAVKRCVAVGLPAVFAWVYDEPWTCYARLRPVFEHFLGAEFKPLPAFWAWHVDPKKGETGWKPHRDNRYNSLAADGSPISLTCWIPLSDANPLNSCMYIVPRHMDPGYSTPAGMPEPPTPVFAARALPAKPGDYLVWNQCVMHWGGPTSEFAEHPRMSMALNFSAAMFNPSCSHSGAGNISRPCLPCWSGSPIPASMPACNSSHVRSSSTSTCMACRRVSPTSRRTC
ncbi:phytanoyl-CoA dioxygenase family protein [Variovorax sp. DT-64]|uniref:phytanoyl-CoA dioxygenase family protein n=1 Tax=Variovorax sp. DT-64 TaxID=3396160 RepID=UPI003F1AE659